MNRKPWPRAILLMDMNAFFASIEQLDFPEFRRRPVAVTNGTRGSCVITCSYEARHYGVKTGMRLAEARGLCPDLVQRGARPLRYAEVSETIMQALTRITPDIEIFSVDEAFLDITRCQKLYDDPVAVAKRLKQIVYEVSALTCSVGLSTDKTTAKYAAKLEKPDGLQVIPPEQAAARLANVPVTQLCGIAKGIGQFLAMHGVVLCKDMRKLPISVLAKRFGNVGRRIWYMCQGADPDPVRANIAPPKSVGHGKVLPPNTCSRDVLLTYLLHMSEKVAARMRRHELQAQTYFIGVRSRQLGWLSQRCKLMAPSNDVKPLFELCQAFLTKVWQGDGIDQVQVTALDPRRAQMQDDLFLNNEERLQRDMLNRVRDTINQRYGDLTISAAKLLHRSDMPNVIAPAWRPSGTRNSLFGPLHKEKQHESN